MRIYISGPITGTAHYALKFAAAAHRLHEAGHVPANPVLLPAPAPREGDDEWRAWMRATTRLLTDCDGVALLPGWRDSRGAMAEADWADAVGLPVRDLEEWL
jgi:hypothetical protein